MAQLREYASPTVAARAMQVMIFLCMVVWIFGSLGGVSISPKITDSETGENGTSGIFNWHPLLMTFAFVGCMAEAIMAYSNPIIAINDRRQKKIVHALLHSGALFLAFLGVVAAIKSHTLKKPNPMPNFYSTHSYLGILTFLMFGGQMMVGTAAFLFPQWSLSDRQAFAPVHKCIGAATFVIGMMTVMVRSDTDTSYIFIYSTARLSKSGSQIFCGNGLLLHP